MVEARFFKWGCMHVFLYAAPAARKFWKSQEYEPNLSRSKDPKIEKMMKGQLIEVVAETEEPLPVWWKTMKYGEGRVAEEKESKGGDDAFASE